MINKKSLTLFSFFILILLINPVFSTDEYNNQCDYVGIYEKITGSFILNTGFTENPTTTNVTIDEANFPLYFAVGALLNSTFEPDYGDVQNTTGIGLQIFTDTDDDDYENPLQLQFPLYETGGYWDLGFVSPQINIEIDEIAICNVTHWMNYHNGSNWLLEDSWKFNLIIESEDYTPPDYTDDGINFSPFFFWGMVATGFTTPLAFVGAIKLHDGKWIGYGIMSLVGFLCFFGMFTGLSFL